MREIGVAYKSAAKIVATHMSHLIGRDCMAHEHAFIFFPLTGSPLSDNGTCRHAKQPRMKPGEEGCGATPAMESKNEKRKAERSSESYKNQSFSVVITAIQWYGRFTTVFPSRFFLAPKQRGVWLSGSREILTRFTQFFD